MHKHRAALVASAGSRELSGSAHRLAARYLGITGLLVAAGVLAACESMRAQVATPAATHHQGRGRTFLASFPVIP